MKYRKLPIEIEAVQWSGKTGISENNLDEIKAFVGEKNLYININDDAYQAGAYPPVTELYINTLEGRMLAMPKDFIIKGVNGEFYPCKPDIFAKTYERID